MLHLMYDVPTDKTIQKVKITKGVVTGESKPEISRIQ